MLAGGPPSRVPYLQTAREGPLPVFGPAWTENVQAGSCSRLSRA